MNHRESVRAPGIHSFDVFDTCLLRACAFPSDVFIEIAYALADSISASAEPAFAEHFRSSRMSAETAARSKSTCEEVTLEQIWQELLPKLPRADWTSAEQTELAVEERMIRPNRNALARVQAARASGARIVFVSDTYLPSAFVRKQLECHGFLQDGDGLFVSSEIGVTKQTGNLFQHMLHVEGVAATTVRHYGDNAVSDFQVPRSLGIDAQLYPEAALNSCERALLNASLTEKQVASTLAGSCRVLRLGSGVEQDLCRNLVASFLGPFVLTFVSWVLGRARRDGIRRLYFLSRDGYLLSRAARVLAPKFGIEARYLYVSRQALLLPSVREISEAGIPWLRRDFEKNTIQRLLGKLDLNDSIAPEIIKKALTADGDEHVVSGNGEWGAFWNVLKTAPVRQVLESKICERRTQAVSYLTEQGLNDSAEWAVVDLGWFLSCQTAIRQLLSLSETQGYYLGLRPGRNSPTEAGRAHALFDDEAPDRSPAAKPARIFTRIDLLEHLLGLAPHGTVHHYESCSSGAVPVFPEVTASLREFVSRVETLIEEFAAENGSLSEILSEPSTAREILNALTDSFFGQPKREWIEALQAVQISGDQNNIGAIPLVNPMCWHDLIISCLPQSLRRRFPVRTDAWPEGSLCFTPERIKSAVAMRQAASAFVRCLYAFIVPDSRRSF